MPLSKDDETTREYKRQISRGVEERHRKAAGKIFKRKTNIQKVWFGELRWQPKREDFGQERPRKRQKVTTATSYEGPTDTTIPHSSEPATAIHNQAVEAPEVSILSYAPSTSIQPMGVPAVLPADEELWTNVAEYIAAQCGPYPYGPSVGEHQGAPPFNYQSASNHPPTTEEMWNQSADYPTPQVSTADTASAEI